MAFQSNPVQDAQDVQDAEICTAAVISSPAAESNLTAASGPVPDAAAQSQHRLMIMALICVMTALAEMQQYASHNSASRWITRQVYNGIARSSRMSSFIGGVLQCFSGSRVMPSRRSLYGLDAPFNALIADYEVMQRVRAVIATGEDVVLTHENPIFVRVYPTRTVVRRDAYWKIARLAETARLAFVALYQGYEENARLRAAGQPIQNLDALTAASDLHYTRLLAALV